MDKFNVFRMMPNHVHGIVALYAPNVSSNVGANNYSPLPCNQPIFDYPIR